MGKRGNEPLVHEGHEEPRRKAKSFTAEVRRRKKLPLLSAKGVDPR